MSVFVVAVGLVELDDAVAGGAQRGIHRPSSLYPARTPGLIAFLNTSRAAIALSNADWMLFGGTVSPGFRTYATRFTSVPKFISCTPQSIIMTSPGCTMRAVDVATIPSGPVT